MKDKIIATFATIIGVLALASPLNANHLWHTVECELGLGPPKCCGAIGGNIGTLPYHWTDNNKGWFEVNPTQQWYNDFHCFPLASGKPSITASPDGFPNRKSHGVASNRCGIVLE